MWFLVQLIHTVVLLFFFRLKKVQEKNKRVKAAEEEKRKKLSEEGLLKIDEPRNLIDESKDEDILF